MVERRSAGVRRGKSAEHAQDGDRGADDGGEDHAGLREHGAGEPPCQAGLQLGEPGLELVGRHVVSVVGCLSHGGRDGVGELRVGAGGDQGAGDSVGVESGHASFPSLALPVGSIGDAFPAAHPCGDARSSAGFGLFAGGGEILR